MSRHAQQAQPQEETPHLSPHLFLVRVWLEPAGQGTERARLYGRVQHVATGESRYFHDCSELTDAMDCVIPQSPVGSSGRPAGDEEHEDQVKL